MTPPLGLRERKKQRTRETIARVALDLFARQGFEETTIAQIAEAADVSPRTVSGYFPAKEDLAFPEQDEVLERLATRLRERGGEELAPEALRGWLRERIEHAKGRQEELSAQRCVVESSDALRAHRQLFMARVQELLAAAIAEDLGGDPGDLQPRMAAASTGAIIELLGEHFDPVKARALGGEIDVDALEADVLDKLDQAVVFVSAGMRALRGHRAA